MIEDLKKLMRNNKRTLSIVALTVVALAVLIAATLGMASYNAKGASETTVSVDAAAAADSQAAQSEESSLEDETSNHVTVNQLPDSSFLYDSSIADLAAADKTYEGQTVLVRGEVVGDLISDEHTAENCWISLQDEDELTPAVMSVYLTRESADAIDSYGRYGVQGSTLQVRGTFHLQCPDHQGLTDIHAEETTVLAKGKELSKPVDPVLMAAAVFLVLIGLVMLGWYSYKREQQR